MRPEIALACLLFVAAAPAPQLLVPKLDPDKQCAAVMLLHTGDIIVSSGKKCADAEREVQGICRKSHRASVCNARLRTVERMWIVIYHCTNETTRRTRVFMFASEDVKELPSGVREQAAEHKFNIETQCEGFYTFHSSTDK